MSLVCHTIVSRYTPQQRDPVKAVDEEDNAWRTESAFGHTRLHSRPAPSFVPATLEYDEYGMPKTSGLVHPGPSNSNDPSRDVSAWYQGLTGRLSANLEKQPSKANPQHPSSTPPASQSSPTPDSSAQRSHLDSNPKRRNWFTSCPSQGTATHISKPSTLADLLSRNPPPLPSDPTFMPPVFLTIGPSNKGFSMLQRKGWQEGEGLGSGRVERKSKNTLDYPRKLEVAFQERNIKPQKLVSRLFDADLMPVLNDVKHEVVDLTLPDLVVEQNSSQNIIDLTLSDPDSGEDDAVNEDTVDQHEDASCQPTSHGTMLITPIATTLKADRLGIGLKAARHSRNVKAKAVTHTSAALAAHIRSGHQARIDRGRHGRGSRGFARARRKEERERVDLLAYMKS